MAALVVGLTAGGGELHAQLTPPSTGGVVALDALLQRLAEQRRVLVIGAHPDDEDTALLTLAARGLGAEAAYLALSRGEGGQNVLGPELGVALGLLRSRELEAARSVDGARQFFTRAFDFGYTRSLAETESRWIADSVLKDVVRVVRRFRPHVLVSIFSGTARDGHGQHRQSGLMARRAFAQAGDASVFPELAMEEGLSPWAPLKLYRTTRFDTAAATLMLESGGLDPRTGKTLHQIAMASRSQHRSQDFGVLQPTGPAQVRLRLLDRRVGDREDRHLFDGIPPDSSWLTQFADSLRRHLATPRLGDAVGPLASALERARAEGVREERLELIEFALATAAGIVLDATAAEPDLVAGQRVGVRIDVYNGGEHEAALDEVTLEAEWDEPEMMGQGRVVQLAARPLPAGAIETVRAELTVDPSARITVPYFLADSMVGWLYNWEHAAAPVRGLPFEPPPLHVVARLRVAGVDFALRREVTHRIRDQIVGEIRTPLQVIPGIAVSLTPDNLVWSSRGPEQQPFTVDLASHLPDTVRGVVELDVEGWADPEPQSFRLDQKGDKATLTFRLHRPPNVDRAKVEVRARAIDVRGTVFDRGVEEIEYAHIRPVATTRPAMAVVRVADIALPAIGAVGYVRGASDRVPEALARIGLPLEVLDEPTLATGGLARFDCIIIGTRAYETDSALVRHHRRLLEYVRQGGLLVVQYQQYQFVRGGFAPYALDIARPHDRVTDETAPVRVLDPAHRVVRMPNQIGPDDWEEWPQERGLYFARTWATEYIPLLEMPNEQGEPLRGALLVAPYGEGTFVYTGLSFFRALPAGVPGAYRLFLNLVGLHARNAP